MKKTPLIGNRSYVLILSLAAIFFGMADYAAAHPLGNFTINRSARIEPLADRVRLHYVIDMAEIPAFQTLQKINPNGAPTDDELTSYAAQLAPQFAASLLLVVDDEPSLLRVVESRAMTLAGAGGLPTLRIEVDFVTTMPNVGPSHHLRIEDRNFAERLGWREITVVPGTGINVFDSTAFGNSVTNELKLYPEDLLAAPLAERNAECSFTTGMPPAGSTPLMRRDGKQVAATRDRLAELIAVPELTPAIALVGLLFAIGLGALHAMSPGHGKTVVGAYLVGSRGTARHAAFLGLTVTITHTAGVFALGLATLFASQYVLPEKLFPILSLISGGIVVVIGGSLFFRRLRGVLGTAHTQDEHHHTHDEQDGSPHVHSHGGIVHSHGSGEHSHLPPGADGSHLTWRSLLALGVSGGLLPCPSALVVLLSAISLHRVGYGLLLVIAFSLGLAGTLTAVGLLFVYAGKLVKRPLRWNWLTRVLPLMSAFVISCAGLAICYEAIVNTGIHPITWISQLMKAASGSPDGSRLSTVSALLFGLLFGLKHAVEADHLAAVSTIVSERKSLLSSSLVGGLWGVGHTLALLIAGIIVLLLNVKIGERASMALEFMVALMLIVLGFNALRRLLGGGKLHFHTHGHGPHAHTHPHTHGDGEGVVAGSHHRLSFGVRPLVVGLIHGLAGSAALMLLVLTTVNSRLVGLVFIVVFGIGSIGGMMAMSLLLGLPLRLTASRFARTHKAVQALAAIFSLGLGLMMAYQIGILDGLFG